MGDVRTTPGVIGKKFHPAINVMSSVKRDLKFANVNFEIVKYDCLTYII